MNDISRKQDTLDDQAQLSMYKEKVQKVLGMAADKGASSAEAGLSIGRGLSVTVRLGEVETVEHNRDQGLGITVYLGQRKGSASTTDLSDEALSRTVAAACDIARYTSEDECNGLADKDLMATEVPDLDLYHPWRVAIDEAIDMTQRCEQVAMDYDKRIHNSEGASLSSQEGIRIYGNSHGFLNGYPTTRQSLSCTVLAEDEDGMQRDYWYTTSRCADDLEDVNSVGEKAAQRTVARLNARRLGTCQSPVIFSAELASGLFSSFLAAIKGTSQYRQTSFLLDSLGQQVFPEYINLREEPLIKRGLASAPYDNEGVCTQAHDIVSGGKVNSYVLSSYSARKLGLRTTGNAGGTHNVVVSHGVSSREQLLGKMGTGLYITELMGQGINRVTGDYSRGASGFWVENGEMQYPVHEITVAGNLKDMFKGIVDVATDVDTRRSLLTGSVLLDNMTIAGE